MRPNSMKRAMPAPPTGSQVSFTKRAPVSCLTISRKYRYWSSRGTAPGTPASAAASREAASSHWPAAVSCTLISGVAASSAPPSTIAPTATVAATATAVANMRGACQGLGRSRS